MLWLLACTEQGITDVPENAVDPSAYDAPDRDTPADPLSLEEIEAAIPELITEVFQLDPKPLFDAQSQLMAQQDDACPYYNDYYQEYYGTYFWEDHCTTSTGLELNGWSEYLRLQEFEYGGAWVVDYGYFFGDAQLTLPDGQNYLMAGETLYNDVQYDGYRYYKAELTGSYRWEGTDYEDTWLGQSRDAYLFEDVYDYDFGAKKILINGGVTGLNGAGGLVRTISFDSLLWMNGEYGSGCPAEPGGKIRLRDGEGRWYEVYFHGPTEENGPVFPPLCDGCGEVYQNGVFVGDICPDLTPLMQWGEEGPWR